MCDSEILQEMKEDREMYREWYYRNIQVIESIEQQIAKRNSKKRRTPKVQAKIF